MLWPAATNLHSSVTFSRPLSVNLVNPRFLLTPPNTVSTSTERLFRKADPISVRSILLARLLKAFKAGFAWIRFGESGSADFEHLALREQPEQSSHSYVRTALS